MLYVIEAKKNKKQKTLLMLTTPTCLTNLNTNNFYFK